MGLLLDGNRKHRLCRILMFSMTAEICEILKLGRMVGAREGTPVLVRLLNWNRFCLLLLEVQYRIIQGSFPTSAEAPADGGVGRAHPQPSPCLVIRHHKDKFAQKSGKNDKMRTQYRKLLCRCCFAAHPTRMRFLCYLPAWEKQQPHVKFLATILGLRNVFCHSSFRVIFVPATEEA